MKYILEIKPEYEDSFKGLMILGAKDSNLFIDVSAVDDLEELTADYINEHYGDLQDTAYQRGLEDGKQTVVGAAELREKLEYQKGFNDGKAQVERGCEGCKYEDRTSGQEPCCKCARNDNDYWTAKQTDDEIKVGDEVTDIQSGANFLVTHLWESNRGDKGVSGFNNDCSAFSATLDKVSKTGRHFDIDKILEEMRHD